MVGLAIVLFAAIRLSAEYRQRDLDADLSLQAIAVYGLAWMDEDGVFHDDLLRREPLVQRSPFDVWVWQPGDPPVLHYRPDEPRFEIPKVGKLVERVVGKQRSLSLDGIDRNGRRYRLRAIPSYDDQDNANLAILVAGDVEPSRASHRQFVQQLVGVAALVALLGIAVGAALARRSLAPVAATYEQRERFLGGAAHELRTPVAGLRAICESAAAGDESADKAVGRLFPVVLRTAELVESLLLYARLGANRVELDRTTIRLDLLAEACIPEHDGDGADTAGAAAVELRVQECVVEADPKLLEVAIRNLLANASRHAAAGARTGVGGSAGGNLTDGTSPQGASPIHAAPRIRILVDAGGVTVEDDGPGFPEDLLERASEPFVSSPGSRGVGLGLALVGLIAELHGGELLLENRPEGGARTKIRLPGVRVS